MTPVQIAPETERGYYVVWNANLWERERVSSLFLAATTLDLAANFYRSENWFLTIHTLRAFLACLAPSKRPVFMARAPLTAENYAGTVSW